MHKNEIDINSLSPEEYIKLVEEAKNLGPAYNRALAFQEKRQGVAKKTK